MKFSALILSLIVMITSGFVYAETPALVEMPMTQNWSDLPDTQDINVIWFSDDNALLAVTAEGLKLLDQHSIHFDTLGDMLPDRHYYIVGTHDSLIPESLSGVQLVSGHYLVNVSTETLMPYNRDLYYQRLWPSQRTISALIPPEYQGYASKEFNPVIQEFVDQVSETRIYELLVQMVSYDTRFSFAPELLDAVDWAVEEFESWGYDVETPHHTSGMAPNVIATKPGLINPDRIWVVGGHFDSISPQPYVLAPGANDNGTGSALTMHTAELLKDEFFADTVIYALWTGEEQGLYGSAHWAAWAASEGLDIQGYYNFDMIGWEDSPEQDLDVIVNNASFDFGQDFVDVADMYTDLLHNLYIANVTASDHASFWQNGYIAFCGIEDYWPPYPYYHTIYDTVDKISIPFTTEVTRAMVANICTAAQLVETISFKQSYVACNTELDIVVIDFDASNTVTVTVSSDSQPTPETIVLTETDNFIFEGSITVTDEPPVPGDGRISVTHGDVITANYALDNSLAFAEVDCVPPVITDIEVSNLSAELFTVTWQTNEPGDSVIFWGESTPPENSIEISRHVTSHHINLQYLQDDSDIYFMVQSSDRAGNTAIDNNAGDFYQVTTLNALWSQPASPSNPGRVANQRFPDAGAYTSYVADDFTNTDTWIIDQIVTPGQLYNGGSSLANAQNLHWRIYPDDNGLPSGHPSDTSVEPYWSLDLDPSDSTINLITGLQVSMVDTLVVLDTPIELPPGTWWLFFYPTMRFQPHGQFGRLSSDTSNLSMAKFINPGGGFGRGTGWNDWSVMGPEQHDTAFTIVGSVSDTPPGNTGVSITMPSDYYYPGDTCFCTLTVTNADATPLTDHPLFLILDVFGELFFAPSFTSDFDFYPGPWPHGNTIIEALPQFEWPHTGSAATGIIWYAALTDPEITNIYGEWDMFEFGWE